MARYGLIGFAVALALGTAGVAGVAVAQGGPEGWRGPWMQDGERDGGWRGPQQGWGGPQQGWGGYRGGWRERRGPDEQGMRGGDEDGPRRGWGERRWGGMDDRGEDGRNWRGRGMREGMREGMGRMQGGFERRTMMARRFAIEARRLQVAFDFFDRNLDGVVEWSEVRAVLDSRFRRLDANGDGRLDRADVEARLNRRFDAMANPPSAERRTQVVNRVAERMMARFGKPADGSVTADEFAARFEPMFRAISPDGRLTIEQVRNFIGAMRMLRG